MQRRLIMLRRHQGGLTLVELMIAIVLVGIVTGAITMVISDVFSASARTSNHMTAVRQVQSAEYWLSRDIRQALAEKVDLSPTDGQLVVVEWPKFDEATKGWHTIIVEYILSDDGNLRRLEYTRLDSNSDPDLVADTIVAQHIDDDQTILRWNDSETLLVLRVKATVGVHSETQSETREYEIKPRLGSSDAAY